MEKWISAENPPEQDENAQDNGTVLVLLNDRWIRTGFYKFNCWHYHTGIFLGELARGPYKVTGWMPLPELPK